MSHRIKRLAAFAIFARFYLVAAVDSILGFYRHQTDTKKTPKPPPATTESSLPDQAEFGVQFALSQAKVSFPVRLLDAAGAPWRATPQVQAQPALPREERTLGRDERTAAPSSFSFRHSHRSSPRSDLRPDQAA